MKIRYFIETDTLYVALNDREVTETRELNENTILDLDADGNLVAFTLEHARETVNVFDFSFQQITANWASTAAASQSFGYLKEAEEDSYTLDDRKPSQD